MVARCGGEAPSIAEFGDSSAWKDHGWSGWSNDGWDQLFPSVIAPATPAESMESMGGMERMAELGWQVSDRYGSGGGKANLRSGLKIRPPTT